MTGGIPDEYDTDHGALRKKLKKCRHLCKKGETPALRQEITNLEKWLEDPELVIKDPRCIKGPSMSEQLASRKAEMKAAKLSTPQCVENQQRKLEKAEQRQKQKEARLERAVVQKKRKFVEQQVKKARLEQAELKEQNVREARQKRRKSEEAASIVIENLIRPGTEMPVDITKFLDARRRATKKDYWKLAKKYHPDKNSICDTRQYDYYFQIINESWANRSI